MNENKITDADKEIEDFKIGKLLESNDLAGNLCKITEIVKKINEIIDKFNYLVEVVENE